MINKLKISNQILEIYKPIVIKVHKNKVYEGLISQWVLGI